MDARGKPTVECCWACADKGGRLRPELASEGVQGAKAMVTRFRAGPGCLEDPTFKEEMTFALDVDKEDSDFSGFMPSSDVLNGIIRLSGHSAVCATDRK